MSSFSTPVALASVVSSVTSVWLSVCASGAVALTGASAAGATSATVMVGGDAAAV